MIRKCKLIQMPTKIWKCRSIMGGEERIHKEEQRKLYCSLFVNGLSLGDKSCKSKKGFYLQLLNCLTHLQLFNCLTHEAT